MCDGFMAPVSDGLVHAPLFGHTRGMTSLILLSVFTAAANDTLVFVDERPTTLLPLYATTDADLRAQDLVYDRLFFTGAVS